MLRIKVLLLLFVLLHRQSSVGAAKNNAKIIGGQTINIAKIPYIVYLRKDGRLSCGGSLVNPQHVLTAAHCVKGQGSAAFTVTGGSSLISSGGVTRNVTRIALPTAFSFATMRQDIAMLRLDSPLTGPNIATIPLCNTQLRPGDTVRVSGWGITSPSATRASNRLRTVQIKLLSRQRCRRAYQNSIPITRTMMCGASRGKDSCKGDSGGPLVFRGRLCGIVSWGQGCARPGFPGVYTIINEEMNFIRNNWNL